MRIVPYALHQYFIKNIPIKDTILNHQDIYNFCMRLKVNSGWSAEYHNIKPINPYINLSTEEKIKFIKKEGWHEYYGNNWKKINSEERSEVDLETAFLISCRKYLIYDKNKIKLSKNTRYYISNSGGSLYKHNINDDRIIGVNVGFITTIFNNFEEKPMKDYNINYEFYIKECRKIIDSIEDKQMSLF